MAGTRPSQPASSQRRHAHFIEHFTEKRAKTRIAKRKVPLTPAQHKALCKRLDDVDHIDRNYADNTEINIAGILRKWKKYCEYREWKDDWKDLLKTATRSIVMSFLHWVCEHSDIYSYNTSWQYFRQFKQLYTHVTGKRMDMNDSKEILKYHDTYLRVEFGLRAPNSHGKDVANSNDLLVLLTFNFEFDTGIFSGEMHRVNLAGIYIGLACTGARPAEFVDNERKRSKDLEELFPRRPRGAADEDETGWLEKQLTRYAFDRGRPKALCWEDILLMIVRHPVTGEDIPAMGVKFAHHKGADNKPKPTIFFFTPARRLIFCFINIIVCLAVREGVFAASNLTSARQVYQIKNRGPVTCTPLRWKEEWLKEPVFRRCDDSIPEDQSDSSVRSKYRPIPYHRLRDDMARQSLDCGCERAIEPKAWRRGAANSANGRASDAVRDQMMRHDLKWITFNNSYINERVQFHLQNAVLDEPTEDSLIEMLSHLGLTRDPRARKNMVPDEVWESMPSEPEIEALKAEREQLKGGQYRIMGTEQEERIRQLTKLIAAKQSQHTKAIQQEYRNYYFQNRPTWDVEEAQANREEEKYVEPTIALRIPERARLAEIFRNQQDDLSPEELLKLRIRVCDLMIDLCGKRETAKRKRIEQRAPLDIAIKEESPGPDCFPLVMNRTQCPRCIGDESLSYKERTFNYTRCSVMWDHFDRQHAKQISSAGRVTCIHPKCGEEAFKDLCHFKNHVDSVHRVSLRA